MALVKPKSNEQNNKQQKKQQVSSLLRQKLDQSIKEKKLLNTIGGSENLLFSVPQSSKCRNEAKSAGHLSSCIIINNNHNNNNNKSKKNPDDLSKSVQSDSVEEKKPPVNNSVNPLVSNEYDSNSSNDD
jgi:hypothetical protein